MKLRNKLLHIFWINLCAFELSCGAHSIAPPPTSDQSPSSPPETEQPAIIAKTKVKDATVIQCAEQFVESDDKNNLSRLKFYHRSLPSIIITTPVVPVLYWIKPTRRAGGLGEKIWAQIKVSKKPRKDIRALLKQYATRKEILRKVFLPDGYLFVEEAYFAHAVVRELTLGDLFDAPKIFLHRGNTMQALTREGEEYVDEKGHRAKLLLNDRVARHPTELISPDHFDLKEIRKSTGARIVRPLQTGNRSAWVELIFPEGERFRALIELNGIETRVACIEGDETALGAAKRRARQFWRRLESYRQAALLMVSERLRFDEPKDELEDVQEDGELRVAWYKAYRNKESVFKYREVEYPVFNDMGNPVPPQVCIDFIIDVWERSSGTWFAPQGKPPERMEGTVNFSYASEFSRRSIPSVLKFAVREDSFIMRYNIPRRHWIPFAKQSRFARTLARHALAFREGDALIIHGIREQDLEEHYHAALILETDPLTGIPTRLGDNQGRPRIGTLQQVMQTAPQRSVKFRIRLDTKKLREFVAQDETTN